MYDSSLEEKTGQLFIYLFFNSEKHTLQGCKASGQTYEQELNCRITRLKKSFTEHSELNISAA